MDNKQFDIVIIGGGAAGMVAAISAKTHNPQQNVAIIEKSSELGRKILVSGAGRCNLTNIQLKDKPERFYQGTGKELVENVFSEFGYDQIVNFFENLGVRLAPEKKGEQNKVFPVTQQAKTILLALESELKHQKVEVLLNTEVINIQFNKKENIFRIQIKGAPEPITAKKMILTTGGQTYPVLGGNGAGYELAKSFGHKIIPPIVSAVPLEAKNALSQALQGVKMELGVELFKKDKKIASKVGDVIFTKYGLSGSAIFELSRLASVEFNRNNVTDLKINLNFYPDKKLSEVKKWYDGMIKARPHKPLIDILRASLPFNLPPVLFKFLEIDLEAEATTVSKSKLDLLLESLVSYEIKITGTRSWDEAEFTAGGVDASEIKLTLESKKVPGLYFAGEVVDVDGEIGGFNLSWAWSSGFVAGELK